MAQTPKQPTDTHIKQQARKNILKRTFLSVEAVAYVLTNILLLIINYLTDYSYRWHYWAIVGWGAGLILHGFVYTMSNAKIERGETTVLLFHLAGFVIGNGISLFSNVFDGTSLTDEINWFIYVTAIWTSFLLIHLVIYAYNISQKHPASGQSADLKAFQKRTGISFNAHCFCMYQCGHGLY